MTLGHPDTVTVAKHPHYQDTITSEDCGSVKEPAVMARGTEWPPELPWPGGPGRLWGGNPCQAGGGGVAMGWGAVVR